MESYDPEKHYEMIKSWYEKRNLPVVDSDLFPQIGFVVPKIAAAFLYKTDSKFGLIENVISNPESEPSKRDEALLQIGAALVAAGIELKFKLLVAFTDLEVIIQRSLGIGMVAMKNNQTLLMRRM